MSAPPASVAIIGAGPAGLVAAKTLLALPATPFLVTLFERQPRVGGLWAHARDGDPLAGTLSRDMMTNLSRFTVAFSDLAWERVALDADRQAGRSPPMFPRAWQVGRYLEEYRRRYVPAEAVRLGCEVVGAERVVEGASTKWKIGWRQGGAESSALFDYLIVASGFFDRPRPLRLRSQPSFGAEGPSSKGVTVIHSTAFRGLETIFPRETPLSGKILIIGGSMSGAEAAANAAFYLSDAAYSSTQNASKESVEVPDGIQICHVASRPFYSVPRHLPISRPGVAHGSGTNLPSFLPVDLMFYDLSRRSGGTISANTGRIPPEKTASTHRYLRGFVGDQSDLGPSLVANEEELREAGYVAISDTYAEFVRSGAIAPMRGTVTRLEQQQGTQGKPASLTATVVDGDDAKSISDVVAVVHATGFRSRTALDWLDPTVLDELEYDEELDRLPIFLQDHAVHNEKVPRLGFVGFYEGPFWGVMEMQARVVADRFLAQQRGETPKPSMLDREKEHAKFEELRAAIRKQDRNVPQFWQGDCVGIVEDYARFLGVKRDDEGFGVDGLSSPSCAARYTWQTPSPNAETQTTLQSLRTIIHSTPACASDALRSAALFHALQGVWSIHRTITSALPSFPSGLLDGTAHFHPRSPSAPGYAAEYFYEEHGRLRMTNGYELTASRQYAYRLSDGIGHRDDVAYGEMGPEAERGSRDGITAWFVKEDRSVDYLFHRVRLNADAGSQAGCNASGSHLCVKDTYETEYTFEFQGASLKRFNIKYAVSGPSKDYTHDTWFQRPEKKDA